MTTRPQFLAWLVLAIAALVTARADAQTCTQYSHLFTTIPAPNQTAWATTPQLSCASAAGMAGSASSHCIGLQCQGCGLTWANGASNGSGIVQTRACPPPTPTECTGNPAHGVGDQFTSTVQPSGGSYCNPVSGCKMAVTSSTAVDGTTLYSIKHTTEDCAGSEPTSEGADLDEGENCANGSGGEFCLSNQGENCGYLNDAFVCLPQIDNDGCEVFGDGGRVCGSAAPTPPVPDNGTPGQQATPNETITVTTGSTTNTYNYYNSTTVNNSARPPGSSGDNPFDGDDDGDGSNGDGEGEGEGDDSCPEGATCDGTLPEEFDEVCTFLECAQDFYDRVANAPMMAALANAATSFPVGACPAVNIAMFGETMSLSEPVCDIWTSQIAGAVSALMLVIFAWVATRIVLSA